MESEEIREEATDGISRRKMLQRIGAGVAIAWTAPILTSIGTPAFAAGSGTCAQGDCFSTCGQGFTACSQHCGDQGLGVCFVTTEGGCACAANDTCGSHGFCTTSSDCDAGYVCLATTTCCGVSVCEPICTQGKQQKGGVRGGAKGNTPVGI